MLVMTFVSLEVNSFGWSTAFTSFHTTTTAAFLSINQKTDKMHSIDKTLTDICEHSENMHFLKNVSKC